MSSLLGGHSDELKWSWLVIGIEKPRPGVLHFSEIVVNEHRTPFRQTGHCRGQRTTMVSTGMSFLSPRKESVPEWYCVGPWGIVGDFSPKGEDFYRMIDIGRIAVP